MPLASLKPLMRSTSFRVSIVHAGLLVLTLIGAESASWFATNGLAERQARDRILLEHDAIAREITHESLARGADAVMARTEKPGALEYGLFAPSGRHIAGDLVGYQHSLGWQTRVLANAGPGSEGKERVLMLTRRLPDGSVLTIADDLGRAEALRDVLFKTLVAAGGLALLLGLAAGFALTRRTLARMDSLTATMRRVTEGDLSARVALRSNRNDDIDALARGLNQMLDRIDRLVTAVRRVSADVAHDLRTPLTHVRQRIEKASFAETPDERAGALAVANDGIDAALRLFDAMLRLAEIDAGGAKARFAPLDLNEVADRVVDAYRPELENSGKRVIVIPGAEPVVFGDEDLVAQAVANLLENAQKHAHNASAVTIRIREDDARCAISVEDDGCGMTASDFATAIRPFGRLDTARTSPGFGLGLSIAEAVASIHDGALRLEQLKPGLCVTLELPRYRRTAAVSGDGERLASRVPPVP